MKVFQRLREVFNSMKHGKPAAKYCPRCGSPKLKLSSSLDFWLTPAKYVCQECGYKGPLVMELEEERDA